MVNYASGLRALAPAVFLATRRHGHARVSRAKMLYFSAAKPLHGRASRSFIVAVYSLTMHWILLLICWTSSVRLLGQIFNTKNWILVLTQLRVILKGFMKATKYHEQCCDFGLPKVKANFWLHYWVTIRGALIIFCIFIWFDKYTGKLLSSHR